MKVKSENEVAQSCPTLSDPMDCSLPGSSIHGILQARLLEWGAIAFSEDLYIENYKTLIKEIKEDTNTWEKYTMFMDQKNQYSENEYTTQTNLQIQCNLY